MIPHAVASRLSASAFRRKAPEDVSRCEKTLQVTFPATFREFYTKNEGPFGSDRTGFQLLDLCTDTPTIESSTHDARELFSLPHEALVVSNLLGGSVLVFSTERDLVYNMDFEGGLEEFTANKMTPQWNSWASFLEYYFSTPK